MLPHAEETAVPDVRFRPLRPADFPLLHRWLGQPHVAQWWGEPPTLEAVAAKYGPRCAGFDPTRSFIAELDGAPAGLLQWYRIVDHPDYAAAVEVEPGAAGVDLFLGEPELLYRGLGPPLLVRFLREVVFGDSRVTCCVVGPDPANEAAIRAYARSGFRLLKLAHVPGESAPEYLMRLPRDVR